MATKDEIREAAEGDLIKFINLVAPYRVLGAIHKDVIHWWTNEDANDHQLLLMPRDHGKSAMVAYRVLWELTRNPTMTFLYISATSTLAEKQLYFIKTVMESKKYQHYWPDMINPMEGRREKWTEREIIVDHPLRKAEGVRDPSIFTAGLTTTITGLHFDVAVLDDVVIKENAYTNEGRTKVADQYSLLASIESANAREWVVGTRYHPKDLYSTLVEIEEDSYDEHGDLIGSTLVYDIKQFEVEDNGDGTGEFLWPRQQRPDGKWFGFNIQVLAKKRAKYIDKSQYYAQYYNNPNDPTGAAISDKHFQYYDRKFLTQEGGTWFIKDKGLSVFAAIDFAFSTSKKADYTAIAVIGLDNEGNIYVLEIDRFKTRSIKEYFEHIMTLHTKWGFGRIAAEVNVAQDSIVDELRTEYIKKAGILLKVDPHRPDRHGGTKQERMAAVLEPKYDNLAMWHYRGGHCQTLEEELVLAHPPHDDIKDSLSCAIKIATPPSLRMHRRKQAGARVININNRFGGVAYN